MVHMEKLNLLWKKEKKNKGNICNQTKRIDNIMCERNALTTVSFSFIVKLYYYAFQNEWKCFCFVFVVLFCCFRCFFFFRGVIYLQNMKKSDTIPISKLTLYFAEIAIYLHTLSPKSHNLQRFKSIKNIINAWWWRWNHVKHSLTDFCLSKRYSLEDEEIKNKQTTNKQLNI